MLQMDQEFRVSFERLDKGTLYKIIKLEKSETKFYGKTTQGVKAHLEDGEIVLTTFLPKKVVESITEGDFTRINAAGTTEKKDAVCFYGVIQVEQIRTFVGRIHKHGEGNCLVLCTIYC